MDGRSGSQSQTWKSKSSEKYVAGDDLAVSKPLRDEGHRLTHQQ